MTALPETPSLTTSKRNLAAFGVMLVIFLFAVDATIVSTAMPTIVANLGGLELYSWVFSIYMLTSALTTPLFGKLSDLYSQRRLMLIGIAIFIFGSTLCGLAQSMEALVLFRALQGLGGGAIYALSFIVVGILYSPAQRAKMQSLISGVWGVASILGPLAGGGTPSGSCGSATISPLAIFEPDRPSGGLDPARGLSCLTVVLLRVIP